MIVRRWLVIAGTAVAGAIAGFAVVSTRPMSSPLVIRSTTSGDIAAAERGAAPYVIAAHNHVVAGILPHHTLVAPIIKAYLDGIRETPKRVIVLGPDHQDQGVGRICTTARDWIGVTGPVKTDGVLAKNLVNSGIARFDDHLLEGEHGVNAIVPFIHRRWPKAVVVAITMKSGTSPTERDQLVRWLTSNATQDDLVLASVDFSHYHSLVQANAEDAVSLTAIEHLDVEQALAIPVDGPGPIAVVLVYVRQRHAQEQRLRHLNSAEYLGQPDLDSTTSYLFSYFIRP